MTQYFWIGASSLDIDGQGVCFVYWLAGRGERGENTLFFVCSQFSHNTDSQCSLHTILMLNSQNTDAQFSKYWCSILNYQNTYAQFSIITQYWISITDAQSSILTILMLNSQLSHHIVLSPRTIWHQDNLAPNCPVPNCPVPNCPWCQIVRGAKLSWCQIVL